jgi:hypothetical protein
MLPTTPKQKRELIYDYYNGEGKYQSVPLQTCERPETFDPIQVLDNSNIAETWHCRSSEVMRLVKDVKIIE